MIHYIDVREKKSPRFLLDFFPDAKVIKLEVGDWFNGTILTEIKCEKDFSKHTEPIQRIHDEFYRMRVWQTEHKDIDLHAIWLTKHPDDQTTRLFLHYCFQYSIWGHIVESPEEMGKILKNQDDGIYKRDRVFMKTDPRKIPDFARRLHQISGISEEIAIKLAVYYRCEANLVKELANLDDFFGKNKDGTSKAIAKTIQKQFGGE